eukprot:TRINITY_DN12246_c0_g1_i2.p2 TRINITY_DN12246_c0_g1~~TRINITY_DN12246_c0_g1_i2.p2  ORF type:complete len:181 (+),score=54.87 TRINITY_DN12246_c0_g1_i2:737-1279(+)
MEAQGVHLDDNTMIAGALDGTLGGMQMGGYLCGAADAIDTLRSYGSSFIFTTSVPPALLAASCKAIERVERDDEARAAFAEQTAFLKDAVSKSSLPEPVGDSHLLAFRFDVPKESSRTFHERVAASMVQQHNMLVQPIVAGVQPGEEAIRVNASSAHTEEMSEKLVEALEAAAATSKTLL